MSENETIKLMPTKPEAEVAADLKKRLEDAIGPVLAIMDEAMTVGLQVQFDAIQAQAPLFRHKLVNLRIAKHY